MYNYLTIEVFFVNQLVKNNLVGKIHNCFIEQGFTFKGGFRYTSQGRAVIETTLEELSNHHQAWMEEQLRLGLPTIEYNEENWDEYYQHNLKQVLFEREGYRELRGCWSCGSKYTTFQLLVPEDDVFFYKREGKVSNLCYYKCKLAPLIKLAQAIWATNQVIAIQTYHECSDEISVLSDIISGRNVQYLPFAIITELAYNNFLTRQSNDYFSDAIAKRLPYEDCIVGIYIERTDPVV